MSNPNIASRFDEIYKSTHKAVLAYIVSKCGRTADINDIFQDAYMELYKILIKHGVEYITNEKALIFRIAKRKMAQHYSLLERLQIFVSMNVNNKDGEEADRSDFKVMDYSMEEYTVNQEILDNARKFIINKSEDIKKVYYLFYAVGLTIPEIANILSMNESSVKNKLYRTLKELRELFK